MRLPFLPREEKFFFLIYQGSLNIQKISRKLQDLIEHYELVPEKVQEIKQLEHVGDEIIHNIMNAIHRTFVTPIDREDIAALGERLDDVVDEIDETARIMLEYRIDKPTNGAKELARIIVQCSDELEKATSLLHFKGAKLKEILPHTVELNRLENEADQVTSKSMGELFSNGYSTVDIIKWRDIYSHLEGATDRCEDAANILEAIVIKQA